MADREAVLANLADLAADFATRTFAEVRDEVVPPRFRGDRDFMLAAVRVNGMALMHAATAFRADREVVIAALGQTGHALYFASAALQDDREVVLAAVRKNGVALGSASAALRGDRELVLAAIGQEGYAFIYASAALQRDREVRLAAVRRAPRVLAFANYFKRQPAELQEDPELRVERAHANPLAVPGTPAPIIFVDAIAVAPDDGVEATVHIASGRAAVLRLPADATVGDVAKDAIKAFEMVGPYAHVHMHGKAVGPFDLDMRLAGAAPEKEGEEAKEEKEEEEQQQQQQAAADTTAGAVDEEMLRAPKMARTSV